MKGRCPRPLDDGGLDCFHQISIYKLVFAVNQMVYARQYWPLIGLDLRTSSMFDVSLKGSGLHAKQLPPLASRRKAPDARPGVAIEPPSHRTPIPSSPIPLRFICPTGLRGVAFPSLWQGAVKPLPHLNEPQCPLQPNTYEAFKPELGEGL